MALSGEALPTVRRLAAFGLVSADAETLADFYERAFGCRSLGDRRLSGPAFEALTAAPGGARCVDLALGGERIEIMRFDNPGRPYPMVATSSDLVFQHFAIVVADMTEAYGRLCAVPGWTTISTRGPERLPKGAGGVSAFKFRDPEGHPLELLAFPPGRAPPRWQPGPADGVFLGVDHSALSVSDTALSVAFYGSLGLGVGARSLNQGPEQERLDAVPGALVEVTALTPPEDTPHIELLAYRNVAHPAQTPCRSNDIAATWLTFEPAEALDDALTVIDPDGHHLTIGSPIGGGDLTPPREARRWSP